MRVSKLLRLTVLAFAAAAASGCSGSSNGSPSADASSKVRQKLAWAVAHGGGCDCNPASFPAGSAAQTGTWARELDRYADAFAQECRAPQVLVEAFGDGASDVSADLDLAHARASALVRRLLLKRQWQVDAIWFGGPHVSSAATANAMCLTKPIPVELRGKNP